MYKAISKIETVREPSLKVSSSGDVADIVRGIIGDDINIKEHFVLITLDGASNVITSEVISIGTLNQSLVHPREVFRRAILDNSAGIISHNHPSGQLEASLEDRRVTKRLKEVGVLMGIELLDHVIVTDGGYTSLRDEGLV